MCVMDVSSLHERALKGDLEAQRSLILFYEGEVNYWMKKFLKEADAQSLYDFSRLYSTGKNVAPSDEKARILAEKAVELGHLAAKRRLARMYETGRGGKQDTQIADYLFEKFADEGKARDLHFMAERYLISDGIDRNEEKARYWYEKAAEKGNATSQAELALMYECGEGGTANFSKAQYWFEKFEETADVWDLCWLARKYMKEDPIHNIEKARYWYEKAAQKGDPSAQRELIWLYNTESEGTIDHSRVQYWLSQFEKNAGASDLYSFAQELTERGAAQKDIAYWYEKAAQKGEPSAQRELAVICEKDGQSDKSDYWFSEFEKTGKAFDFSDLAYAYTQGDLVEKNNDKARYWYEKAAEKNDVEAQKILAISYELGCGMSKDLEKSDYWFSRFAETATARDLYWLGRNYAQGNQVDKNDERARYWYERAVNKGDCVRSYAALGWMCEEGRGGDKNEEQAQDLFKQFLRKGTKWDFYWLAELYEEGELLSQDDKKATYWYEKAGEKEDDWETYLP